MSVVYNGQSNNFTGEGSPNPQKLVIPGKDKMDPVLATAFLAIEQYINNLTVPESGGSGAYASLTGTGETATPGELDQAGPFTVTTSTASPSHSPYGFVVDVSGFGILMESVTSTSGDVTVTMTMTSSGFTLEAVPFGSGGGPGLTLTGTSAILTGSSGAEVECGVSTVYIKNNAVICTSTGGSLGFFGFGGATQRTVTGSRGGNAALASLLTQLAAYAIIADGTSP
jgi:hypothetical protein